MKEKSSNKVTQKKSSNNAGESIKIIDRDILVTTPSKNESNKKANLFEQILQEQEEFKDLQSNIENFKENSGGFTNDLSTDMLPLSPGQSPQHEM